jgi:hypothetical protein
VIQDRRIELLLRGTLQVRSLRVPHLDAPLKMFIQGPSIRLAWVALTFRYVLEKFGIQRDFFALLLKPNPKPSYRSYRKDIGEAVGQDLLEPGCG